MEKKIVSHIFKKVLKVAALSSTLFQFASCGLDQTYVEDDESLIFSSSALSGGTPLDDGELAVALRICYAFRTKRSKFLAEMLGTSFTYSFNTVDCADAEASDSFTATLTQESSDYPIVLESDFTGNYMSEVQTDTTGFLSDLCSDVLAGETPLNISEVDNSLYEYSFSNTVTNGDKATIKIGYESDPNSGSPSVYQKIIFDILTDSTAAGDYQGMVIEAKRYVRCSDDSEDVKLYQQTLQTP